MGRWVERVKKVSSPIIDLLSFQISNAKKLGCPEELICSSVINAITPGSHLRTYLESKQTLTLTSLIEVMRSHFRGKIDLQYSLN